MSEFINNINKELESLIVSYNSGDSSVLNRIFLITSIKTNIYNLEHLENTTAVSEQLMEKIKNIDFNSLDLNRVMSMVGGIK